MWEEVRCRQACSPLIQLFYGLASDIDQTNINRDIRDGNWLSTPEGIHSGCKLVLLFFPQVLLRWSTLMGYWSSTARRVGGVEKCTIQTKMFTGQVPLTTCFHRYVSWENLTRCSQGKASTQEPLERPSTITAPGEQTETSGVVVKQNVVCS